MTVESHRVLGYENRKTRRASRVEKLSLALAAAAFGLGAASLVRALTQPPSMFTGVEVALLFLPALVLAAVAGALTTRAWRMGAEFRHWRWIVALLVAFAIEALAFVVMAPSSGGGAPGGF